MAITERNKQSGQVEFKYPTWAKGSIEQIMKAERITLEPFTTGKGYYLFLNDHLLCTIADSTKLADLFEIMARRIR